MDASADDMETLVHSTGNSSTASQRKQANNPKTATSRWVFQESKLTKKTAAIKGTQMGEITSRPNLP